MNMNKVIKEYIEQLYPGIYIWYKEKTIQTLAIELLMEQNKKLGLADAENLASIIATYNTQEKINEALALSIEDYQEVDDIKMNQGIKKIRLYMTSLSFLISFILAIGLGFFSYNTLISLVTLSIAIGSMIKLYRTLKTDKHLLYDRYHFNKDTYQNMIKYIDLYKRKSLVSLIWAIFYIMMYSGTFFFITRTLNNISFVEMIVAMNAWHYTIIIFLVIKNVFSLLILSHFDDSLHQKKYLHYSFKTIIYFIISSILAFLLGIIAVFQGYSDILFIPLVFIFIFFVCMVMIQRRHYLVKVDKLNIVKKGILIGLCVFVSLNYIMRIETSILDSYINEVPILNKDLSHINYDEESGMYSITMQDDSFKILQLTDIHLGGSFISYNKDKLALEAVYDLIATTNPDLVMVTGDIVFPVGIFSFSFNNYAPMKEFAEFMRNIGIPWALVYGNHDSEVVASHSAEDLNKMFYRYSYADQKGNLLFTRQQPDITGRNNQIIQLLNQDGSLNQALYLLDSNDYTGEKLNDYDNIHQDQIDWYKDNVLKMNADYQRIVPSLMFFHIPIEEYQEAYSLYKNQDNAVDYYFGKVGEKNEAICSSKYENDLFETIVDIQSTKGIFVGHDHYNNISLGYQGVRLTYGMSIDYLAMPGIYNHSEQRGGTLITIQSDASFAVEQIPLTSIQ